MSKYIPKERIILQNFTGQVFRRVALLVPNNVPSFISCFDDFENSSSSISTCELLLVLETNSVRDRMVRGDRTWIW